MPSLTAAQRETIDRAWGPEAQLRFTFDDDGTVWVERYRPPFQRWWDDRFITFLLHRVRLPFDVRRFCIDLDASCSGHYINTHGLYLLPGLTGGEVAVALEDLT